MTILELKAIAKHFGGAKVITGLDLEVRELEVLGLIGPNGAGKTTIFNMITGFLTPSAGRVIYKGHDITGLKPYHVAHLGIARTFQLTTLFMESTVFDNVFTGFHMGYKGSLLGSFFHTRAAFKEEQSIRRKTLELLEFTGLVSQKDMQAKNLSSAYQKMLAIAVALSANPKLLLLDEPVTTLSPAMVEVVMELVKKVRASGTTVILIEHNMKAIMDHCDRIAVLAYGKKLAEGSAREIRENKAVIEAYLGAMG